MTKAKINTLIASAVAVTLAGGIAAGNANAMSADKEKCYGVVKAGANDCSAAKVSSCAGKKESSCAAHSCAGHAEKDGGGTEWIALPKGVCERLAGGSLEPHKGDMDMDDMGKKH